MSTEPAAAPVSSDAEIGERVHQLIWRLRVSQTAVAGQLGVSQSAMSKKLRGERPWYTGELIAVAALLNVSVGYLFGEVDEGPDLRTLVPKVAGSIPVGGTSHEIVSLDERRAQRVARMAVRA